MCRHIDRSRRAVMRRIILRLCLAAVTAVMLCGCGGTESKRKKEAEELLEKKYGGDFAVTGYKGQEFGKGYYTVTAYAEDWPGLPFEANVDSDGSRVSDDYVCRRICQKISDTVEENLSDVIPYSMYIHTDMMSGDSMCQDPDIGIEEFVSEWEPYNRFYIYIHIDNRDGEDVDGYLVYALSGLSCLKGNMTVYFSDKDTIGAAEKYVLTHSGIGDGYFEEIEEKRRTEYVQYGFENGILLRQGP